jgi:RNA polymerase sigma factor (sigma-70 family)
VGDDERPPIQAINAANRARFEGLPPAGSPAYWAALEDTEKDSRLALEILVMCARERLAARQRDQAEHIYEVLLKRAQGKAESWIGARTLQLAHDRARIIEDIKQECALALWEEIAHPARTFLTEGFWHKLKLMTMNIVEQRLIAEGVKMRAGVEHPTRIPQQLSNSLDQPVGPDDSHTLAESVAGSDEDAFRLIELVNDIRALLADLSAEERSLIQNELTGELTQREMGKRLGISDRAVRMRLDALRAKLRTRHNSPGDSTGGGDGGAGAGKEGQP